MEGMNRTILGGQQEQLPGIGEFIPRFAKGAVEILRLLALHDALAIGRVAQEHAGLALQLKLLQNNCSIAKQTQREPQSVPFFRF